MARGRSAGRPWTPREIDAAIRRAAAAGHDGFSGRCARFAVVLNGVLGGTGEYLLVDGGHYEYADHVVLRHRGRLYDGGGLTSRAALLERWGDDEERPSLEGFDDPSPDGVGISRMADDAGALGGGLDEAALDRDLRAFLEEARAAPGGC